MVTQLGRALSDQTLCAGNAYILETLGGEEEFDRAINGKYLKKYYPSIWINS